MVFGGRVELKVLEGLKKSIFSTSRMCKAGFEVHHTASHSWDFLQSTGAEYRIYERGGVCVIPVWVDHSQGHHGQAVTHEVRWCWEAMTIKWETKRLWRWKNLQKRKRVTRERCGPQCAQRWKWWNDTKSATFPYRPWCSFCVRERGQSVAHRPVEK